jgi:ribosomal protein L30E
MQRIYDETQSSIKVAKITGWSKTTILRYVETKNYLTEEEKKKNKSNSVVSWRKRAKIKLVEYKGGKCQCCGYNKCIDALEFHHLDKKEKDFTISGKSWSFEKIKKETDKCILVCSNCHKEIHAGLIEI